MERINKKLGFGLMRLPMKDGEVDIEQTCLMVDEFIKAGFNYFDTAHGYLSGKSEKAAKTCLTSRYPRESFILTNKLTDEYFKTNDDIRPFFESQLELCGVDYFDFYLMHAQNKARFRYFKERNAYETAIELKKEGKIRHFGISFHDRAEVLDAILSEYPQIEVVQIQFNYLDYDDIGVQSRKCYEVCRKHNKPVLVMEPVKGGSLVKLPGVPPGQPPLPQHRGARGAGPGMVRGSAVGGHLRRHLDPQMAHAAGRGGDPCDGTRKRMNRPLRNRPPLPAGHPTEYTTRKISNL